MLQRGARKTACWRKKLPGALGALVIGILTSASPIAALDIIDSATNPANGHLYYLLESSNWTAAADGALDLGGDLVTINDQDEQDWVYDTFSIPDGVNRNLWIGLHEVSGEWVWESGEAVAFLNWNAGEPNDYQGIGEDVATMQYEFGNLGRWNDVTNEGTFLNTPVYGVVEMSVPEPSTLALVMLGLLGLGARRKRSAERP
jgi:hypothetical protein